MNRLKDFIEHLNGKTTTYEGGVGYKMNFQETLAEFFSLGLLNGKFYQTQEEVLAEAVDIFKKALDECPEFATKCAVYGNNKNSLKLVPTIWLVYLSTLEDKTLFRKAFPKIIKNVNLLHDFMELCRKAPIRKGLGRSIKRTVNEALYGMLNEYSVSRNKGTISEIIKVTRPKFEDIQFQNYMKYVSKDELTFERAKQLKRILEKISNNEIDDDTLQQITKYKFQLEELKHAINNFSYSSKSKLTNLCEEIVAEKDMAKVEKLQAQILELKQKEANTIPSEKKQELYSHMYKGLRYAALMLNLVALERVFATETRTVMRNSPIRGRFQQELVIKTDIPSEIEEMVCNKIKSIPDYRASSILPFSLINAQKMVQNDKFKTAIEAILNVCAKEAFQIAPDTDILVGVDTSGSMSCNINDSLTAIDIATFLGALIKMAHRDTKVCAVADTCKKINFTSESLFEMAENIAKTDVGYGTYFESLLSEYKNQKYIILITDSMAADNLEARWLQLNRPKNSKLIVWQLQAYQIKISQDPSVVYLAGYSDRLLGLIKNIIESNGNQMQEIEAIEL